MTKKEKRKKDKPEKAKKIEEKDVSIDNNKDDGTAKSKSRSRSLGRRSLSAIFRKSASRTGNNKRSTSLTNDDADRDGESASDLNPRVNPRGHLKRMTVREALVYDRRRGRSPNRRTRTLEKKVLENEDRLSSDNLSFSLSHLNHFSEDQSEEPAKPSTSFETRGGSTLPRVKKRHGDSDSRDAQYFRQSDFQGLDVSSINNDKPIQILPLDKRKYLINKRTPIDEPDKADINIFMDNDILQGTNETHSKNNEFQSNIELSENEKRRNETYNTFLSLREKNPLHPHLHFPIEHLNETIEETSPVVPKVNLMDSKAIPSEFQKAKELDKGKTESEQLHNNRNNDTEAFYSNESNETANAIVEPEQVSIIPSHDITSNKDEKPKRSSYVSPRRFSRTSRTSVTSNKSDKSNHSLSNENKPKLKSADSPIGPARYQRHFSKEGRKSKDTKEEKDEQIKNLQQMVDVSTSMNEITFVDVNAEISDLLNCSNNVEIEDNRTDLTTINSVSNDFDASMGIEGDTEENAENEKIADTHDSETDKITAESTEGTNTVPSLHRDVVIVENVGEQIIQTHDHENVFRPIKSDSDLYARRCSNEEVQKSKQPHHVGFEIGEIEVISSEILTENEQHGTKCDDTKATEIKDTTKAKHIKEKVEKSKEIENEKSEKVLKKSWSGKSKKEKRKSKKKNEKLRKGSSFSMKSNEYLESKKLEIKKEFHSAECLPGLENADEKSKLVKTKSKKRKSILKKRSKEKDYKSIKDAIKPITRTASLSHFIDNSESAERRKSVLCDKRSMSMEDISLKKTVGNNICEKPIKKVEQTKSDTKGNKDINAKENKPPKLSIAAIVAIRAKISRMKRAKQAQAKSKMSQDGAESGMKIEDVSLTGDKIQEPSEETDRSVAKVFYENEINTSLGKSDNSLALIEDADKEVKDLVYDRRIQFAPFCDDTISEEEMIKQRQRNTRLTSRRESKVRQRQKKVINCCKKGIAFLFSHIGLCSLVVGYCILGGIVFKALEGENEIEQKKEIKELRQNFTEKIYRLAFETTLTKGNRDIFMLEVNSILKNFSVMIHKQTKEAGWDGKEVRMTINTDGEESVEAEPEQWSYPSSLLYAITVMTTIGYGHVAPKTDEGRIMTIAYAVLGIPLTLLCLTNIGDLMAHGFRSLYGKVCCGLCCILFRPRRRRRLDPEKGLSGAEERMIMQENEKSGEVVHVPTSICLLLMSSYIMLGTLLFAEWENWDMVTGTYFCFITLSTIGFGDVVPGMSQTDWDQQEKLVSCALYLVFGLSLIAMCFNLVQEDVKAKCKWLGMKLGIIDKPVSSV